MRKIFFKTRAAYSENIGYRWWLFIGSGNNQSIKKNKKKYYLIVVDVNPLSAGLYWGDERYLVPYANSEIILKV